jgi:UDP-N-acetylmuramyl pentapeptide phosphotransferase/UDP-N-acetylglucosamine-1-phosphate transferase
VRKIHGAGIPSLGGIGIFAGYILVAGFFLPGGHYILPPTLLLFFTGIYDDLMNMSPLRKLFIQLLASLIPVLFAEIRIGSLYGLAGITALPGTVSLVVTVLVCTLFINAFNFVDGIDGLAGVLAVIYCIVLGIAFASGDNLLFAIWAFSLAGGTLGLLFFNFSPARIYMGDTGSMLLGFTVFLLAVALIGQHAAGAWSYQPFLLPGDRDVNVNIVSRDIIHSPGGAFLLAFAILLLPTFDALRVFALRLSKGRSPLKADRTHLHYYLLDAGCSHPQAVGIIALINIAIIALAFVLQDRNPNVGVACMVGIAAASMAVIYVMRQRNMSRKSQIAGGLSL